MSANREPQSSPITGRLFASFAEPWAIEARAFDALWAAATHPESAMPSVSSDAGVKYDAPIAGVAVLPIYGPIARRPQDWEREFLGMLGQDDIAAELQRAANDPSVRAVLLDFDSPGGHAIGNEELAAEVAALNTNKPVVAFTSGLMASAAYFLASQASVVIATPSAQVGCIGTLVSWLDISGYYQQIGVRREVVVNDGATFKGMGLPGTSLNAEQRAFLAAQVTKMGDAFKAAVRKARGVPDHAMRGQTLFGDEAKQARLIDQIGNFGVAHRTAEALGAGSRFHP